MRIATALSLLRRVPVYEGNTILIDDIITGLFTCQLNANIFITEGSAVGVAL